MSEIPSEPRPIAPSPSEARPSEPRPGDPPPTEAGPGCLAPIGLFLGLLAVALVVLEVWSDRYAWPVDPSWYRVEEADGVVRFGCQNFAPVSFPAAPPKDTVRIVLLGGSTTFGFPERPVGDAPLPQAAHGIAGVLQATLTARWPGRFEVVNLGVNGGTSEDTLRLARRAMSWGPRALVVYDGNNEFMDVPQRITPALWRFALYRRTSVLRAKASEAPGWVGPPAWGDAAAGEAVVARFRRNLEAVADLAEEAGIPLVLATQAGNLAGFDPSWSTAGDPAILASLRARSDVEVERLYAQTPDSADLAWEAGQRRLRSGGDAATALQAAIDHDGMTFRPFSWVNETIRAVAAERSATLVDAAGAVARGGPPGNEAFYDWVHPRPEMARTIGGVLADGLAEAGILPGPVGEIATPPGLPPSEVGARGVRVAVAWLQWACVRAHDPGWRLGMATSWAQTAADADPGNAVAPAIVTVAGRLADPASPAPDLAPEIASRLAGVHRCVAERLRR